MSHAIIIGATAPNMTEQYMEQSAKSHGLHVEVVAEPHPNQKLRIMDVTDKYLPNGQWITMLRSDGELDLDTAYEIRDAIESQYIGRFLRTLIADQSIRELVLIFFDLGTNETYKYEHLIDKLENTLLEYYEFGGPPWTVIHRFKRIIT
jgi:hypothetical protein